MYIFENGAYRQMTAEEFEAFWAERETPPEPEPTFEERSSALESALIAILTGGGAGV